MPFLNKIIPSFGVLNSMLPLDRTAAAVAAMQNCTDQPEPVFQPCRGRVAVATFGQTESKAKIFQKAHTVTARAGSRGCGFLVIVQRSTSITVDSAQHRVGCRKTCTYESVRTPAYVASPHQQVVGWVQVHLNRVST